MILSDIQSSTVVLYNNSVYCLCVKPLVLDQDCMTLCSRDLRLEKRTLFRYKQNTCFSVHNHLHSAIYLHYYISEMIIHPFIGGEVCSAACLSG